MSRIPDFDQTPSEARVHVHGSAERRRRGRALPAHLGRHAWARLVVGVVLWAGTAQAQPVDRALAFSDSGYVDLGDPGDAFDYPKTNGIDRHYHDCDEYWIVYEGRGRAVSEGRFYDVAPGDCVATGMGHHHDFPVDYEPFKAVYFETDLEGQKRKSHLWEYRHGKAHPQPDRT